MSVGYSSFPMAYWLDSSAMSVPYLVGSAPRINVMASVLSLAMVFRSSSVCKFPCSSFAGIKVKFSDTVPP